MRDFKKGVIPAKAGTQEQQNSSLDYLLFSSKTLGFLDLSWVPAFAGMTREEAGMTPFYILYGKEVKHA